MQLDPDWLQVQGADAPLLHWVDTAFQIQKIAKIGIAVSGGGDSMALLHLYHRWSDQTGRPIAAVTVDHGLRAGSQAEAEAVADYCRQAGIPHDILQWGDWDGDGNLQAKAREARYRLIADWARKNVVDGIVLGHTKDDIAETFLMRLARKAGIDGLASMEQQWSQDGLHWARPLWQISREELRAYLCRHDVTWAEDPSNEDDRFERVRVRKAMKMLSDVGIDAENLQHAAFAIKMARNALNEYTTIEARSHIKSEGGDLVLRRVPPRPVEIERRLFSKAIQWMGRLPYPPRATTLIELHARLATDGKGTACGCLVTAHGQEFRISREHQAVTNLIGGTDQLWDQYWRLDGPHDPSFVVRALGEAVSQCPDWRATGLPRHSLMATPAIFVGDTLVAAPIAGLKNGWTAQIVAEFTSALDGH